MAHLAQRTYSLARILSFAWLAVFVVGNLMALRQPTSVRNQAPRTSVINTQPLATPMTSPKKATTTSPPVEAWATKESRDIGGMLFIKPYLRQWLKDPDSLQDFEVIDARPNKTLQDSFRVTVFYHARNSFGALVPEQRTVVMIYNPKDENHPWVMLP